MAVASFLQAQIRHNQGYLSIFRVKFISLFMSTHHQRNLFTTLLLLLFAAVSVSRVSAQQVFELVTQGESGSNGAAVAWHPGKKLYYAVFAGNPAFPLEVFDAKGNHKFESEAGFDVRGLWYNPKTDELQGNGYGDAGWFTISLDASGEPIGGQSVIEGQNQPDPQSVGALNPAKGEVLFYNDGVVTLYSSKGKYAKGISLDLPNDLLETVNYTSMIYTGVKKKEIGLYEPDSRTIYFFDLKKGKANGNFRLPASAPQPSAFNFSYANGRVWLFDQDNRTWKGYKIEI